MKSLRESYVNLIPTPQGGTHVNGFRQGLSEALREFCEFRNLLPRGIKLHAEDIWEQLRSYYFGQNARTAIFWTNQRTTILA